MIKSLLLLAVTCASVLAENVVTLTSDNFDTVLAENEHVLVEFYAPWCGHCKALAPEYEKAATALLDFEPKVVIAKVDATAEDDLAKKFGVQGFPTLKWFTSGEAKDYGGGRTESTIVNWIKKKVGDPATKLEDVASLETLKESADVVVVGAFETEEEAAAFLKAASDEEEVPYGIIVGAPAVATAAGITVPGVTVFKNFDEKRADFAGDITSKDEIATHVAGNVLPLIVKFSQESAPKIFGGKINSHTLMFLDHADAAVETSIKEAATPVAEANKGKMLFVTVDKTEDRILEFFGITEADLPAARIVKMGEGAMKKYGYKESEITTEGLTSFVSAYFEGSLSPDLKSDEIPESQDGPVFVLVGKQFDEIVNKPDTDVLVEFYAPWCGHCKKLAPIYDELGEQYKDNDKLIIAKMDATANEVDSVSVSGFPTIKFFPANSEEIVDFDGSRDLAGFNEFLKKHAKSVSDVE